METPIFTTGMHVRHKELNRVGIVESEIPIRVHHATLRRDLLNVRVDEFDNIWWDISKLIPEPILPTTVA